MPAVSLSRSAVVRHVQRSAGLARRSADDGFTLTEMLVALVIIGIVMSALTTFFITTVSATGRQGTSQTAVQLADDGVERAHAVKGSSLPSGRGYTAAFTQWNNPAPGVAPYLTNTQLTWDSTAATSAGPSAAIPTPASPLADTVVNGVSYYQHWYVGSCWQASSTSSTVDANGVSSGDCTIPTGTPAPTGTDPSLAYPAQRTIPGYVWFYRVIVAVTWANKACANNLCSYVTSTLVSAPSSDPLFNSNATAAEPTVSGPAAGTSLPGVPAEVGLPMSIPLTRTGGAQPYTWSLAPTLPSPYSITVDASGNAALTAGPSGPPSAGSFAAEVSVTDGFGLVGRVQVQFTVYAHVQLSAPINDQTTVVNTTATTLTPTITGGAPGYRWMASGLPTGLRIDQATGAISGTPTTVGATNVTVTVTDNLGGQDSQVFTWNVTPPPLTVNYPTLTQYASTSASVSVQATAINGTGTRTWTATGLPPGLSISSGGLISGTPTTGGLYASTLTVTDTGGNDTQQVSWYVMDITNPTAAQVADVGTAVSLTATAVGNAGTVSWSASGLPTGLVMSPTTGKITGTPTVSGTFTSTLTADDSIGTADTQTITWTVAVYGYLNGTVSYSPPATGVTGTTKTWSITGSPALPTGLSINTSTGQISGTVRSVGVTSVTVFVKSNTNSTNYSQTVIFKVVAAVSITSPTASTSRSDGRTSNITPLVPTYTGGSGNLTWSASNLPTGLSIDPTTGTISGKPTTARNTGATVALTVTDNYTGSIATVSFTWKIT